MVGHYALLWCDMDTGVAAAMMVNGHGERETSVRFALDAARAHLAGTAAEGPAGARSTRDAAGRASSRASTRPPTARSWLKNDDGRLVVRGSGVRRRHVGAARPRSGTPSSTSPRSRCRRRRWIASPSSWSAAADGSVVAITHGPSRYLAAGAARKPEPGPRSGAHQLVGTYRAGTRGRRGSACSSAPGGCGSRGRATNSRSRRSTTSEWRVGGEQSPDRVRFDTVVGGRGAARRVQRRCPTLEASWTDRCVRACGTPRRRCDRRTRTSSTART